MGMYFERLLESGVIQTDDNTGVDLDAIEQAVEEEREGLNDEAESGVLGDPDPVDEAAMIMYESTYNYNQLMRRIGMVELQEFSRGREYIMEGADIRGFFEKVKTILTNMFRAITRAFKNVLNRLVTTFTSDKKLATEHASAIKAGYEGEWKFEGYKFPNEPITYNCKGLHDKMTSTCKKALDAVKNIKGATEDDIKNLDPIVTRCVDHSVIIKENAGVDAEDVSEMRKKLTEKYFGTGKVVFGTNGESYPGGADGVIALLKADKETKAIKEGYKKIKGDYDKALKAIKEYEKSVTNNAKDYDNISAAYSICEKFSSATIFEKNVQNTVYSVCMKAAKAKRAQARRLALLWQRAGTKKNLKDKHPKIQHNSASLFGNIDLI